MSKVAVVTGAASGIGLAAVSQLVRTHETVFCLDRDETGLKKLVEEDATGRCVATTVDVTELRSLLDAAQWLRNRNGRLDALVCSAGVTGFGTVETCEPEHWDRVISVNLTGTWYTMKAFVPIMSERGSGSVVVIGSTAAAVGFENGAPYAASKGGVTSLARQAAIDLASEGVRVNVIAPGSVATPLVQATFDARGSVAGAGAVDFEDARQRIVDLHPIGRVGQPEDVAALIGYLIGEGASWMTGSVVTLDGGLTAR